MKVIDSTAIRSAVPYSKWVDMIEEAFRLDEGSEFIMPERTHIDFDNNTLLVMPCIAGNYFSTKIITLYSDNHLRGKAPLQGMVVLNDRSSGEPLAILDGPSVTAMRTAAVGSYAVRHLSPQGASRLGIVGLGTQGLHQALFACSEREIGDITIFDRNENLYSAFISAVQSRYPGIKVSIADDTRQLCKQSDIIITATSSTEPVLPEEEEVLSDRTVIGIGSYKKDMREFPDTLYRMAGNIYVDSLHGLQESGDLIDPLSSGLLKESDIHKAAELLKGKKGRGSTRVFKSVGTALFDLMGSVLVYETLYMH